MSILQTAIRTILPDTTQDGLHRQLEENRAQFLDNLRDFEMSRLIRVMAEEAKEIDPLIQEDPTKMIAFAWNAARTLVRYSPENKLEMEPDSILARGGLCMQAALVVDAAFHQIAIGSTQRGYTSMIPCIASYIGLDGRKVEGLHVVNLLTFEDPNAEERIQETVLDVANGTLVSLENWASGNGYKDSGINIDRVFADTPKQVFGLSN